MTDLERISELTDQLEYERHHYQKELAARDVEVAKLRDELQKLIKRLDEAFVLGWQKGVTEAIDKLYAYRMSAGNFDGDKAIELLAFHVQHPPARNEQQAALDKQVATQQIDRTIAMKRLEHELNDRKGFHVDGLDEETRADLLGALVDALLASIHLSP